MSRASAAALAAIVLAGTAAYGVLGSRLHGPSVFADELVYMDAARSVADGHRPMERDRPYGRGLLYPLLAAPVVAAAPTDLDAYRALRIFNALLFSLTAIPAYLLARRLLGRGWSVAVAALTVAIPSALYTGMIVTESASYPTGTLALLAVALALERPTWRRQLLALVACGVAALARPQLAVLALSLPLGLGVRWLLLPRSTRPPLSAARRLWPTAAAIAAAAAVVGLAFATGRASLHDYRDVWTSYSVPGVLEWSWYTLGDLALYFAIVPVVVAPTAIVRLVRGGSAQEAAFVGLLLSATATTLLVVAAFSSAKFGFERLHDRYLFYVFPLWLVLLAVWLARGAPWRTWELMLGVALAVALVASLPPHLFVHDGAYQFDATATGIWSRLRDLNTQRETALRLALVVAAVAAAAAAAAARFVPRRARPLLVAPIVAVFLVNAGIVWRSRIADSNPHVFADDRAATWSWVDRRVGGAGVTDVVVDSSACFPLRDAFRWTEFFNGSIGAVLRIGLPPPPGLVTDGEDVDVASDGVVRHDRAPVRPRYVVAPPGLRVRGDAIARGTVRDLVLWKVDGDLRVAGATSNLTAMAEACA